MKEVIISACFILFGWHQAVAAMVFEGIVKPVQEVELVLPIDGVIANIFVKEGDNVKKGDKLVQLDDKLQRLEVERRKEIFLDNAELESNRKNLKIIKALLDSSKGLYEKTSSVSLNEVQNLEMQYYTLEGKVNVSEGRKKQEQIEYEISQEVLARYVLVSPVAGVVTVIKHEEGEWARTGETIITVVDTSTCYAEFNIEEKYARAISKGKLVSLRVREGDSMNVKKGKIFFVSPVADKASSLVKVKVEFDNAGGRVIPGVLARISFD